MQEHKVQLSLPVKNAKIVPYGTAKEDKVLSESYVNLLNKMLDDEVEKNKQEFAIQLNNEKKKAYQSGFKDGTTQSEKKYFQQFNKSFILLKKISDSLNKQVKQAIEQEEQNILSLLISISKKIVDTEIQMNPDIILNVLRNALNLLNERRSIKVFVNPSDWSLVKSNINQLKLKIDLPEEIDIISSLSIAQGGCKIDSESGSIDADLETQFDEIQRRLLKNVSST